MNADTVPAAGDDTGTHLPAPEAPAEGAAPVQETLLEGVSAGALTAGTAASGTLSAGISEAVVPEAGISAVGISAADHPGEGGTDPAAGGGAGDPAGAEAEPEAAPAPPGEDLTLVLDAEPPETATGLIASATAAVENLVPSILEAAATLPAPVPAFARPPLCRPEAPDLGRLPGLLGEANATVLTYLRDEGAAAMAHWQALAAARTPADAIRLQMTEMQRAADASLRCLAALAQGASRLGSGLGRR